MWSGWFDTPGEDIRLIDWGEFFPVEETRTSLAQPFSLRSPEGFFLDHFDFRHDLWRVGRVVSNELLG